MTKQLRKNDEAQAMNGGLRDEPSDELRDELRDGFHDALRIGHGYDAHRRQSSSDQSSSDQSSSDQATPDQATPDQATASGSVSTGSVSTGAATVSTSTSRTAGDGNKSRCLVLGGVEFPDEDPLVGHSDADVICHAVIDALLKAAGLGDIGERFADTDPAYAGASGLDLLRQSAEAIDAAGWSLINADCTVVTDRPMLAPHKPQMQKLLSQAAGGVVTVSGKRTEGLGALGRGEGVVAFAVALLAHKSASKS